MLTDASVLVVLFNHRDQYHQQAERTPAQSPTPILLTTLPCLTETDHQTAEVPTGKPNLKLYSYLKAGALHIHYTTPTEADRAVELVFKNQNVPRSFADASLIAAAKTLNQRRIFTYDRDFQIYRINDHEPVEIIL